tara:strand:- start:1107 stop:2087 length:981 start_codon:yes stop_codon:yes gene_type:complete
MSVDALNAPLNDDLIERALATNKYDRHNSDDGISTRVQKSFPMLNDINQISAVYDDMLSRLAIDAADIPPGARRVMKKWMPRVGGLVMKVTKPIAEFQIRSFVKGKIEEINVTQPNGTWRLARYKSRRIVRDHIYNEFIEYRQTAEGPKPETVKHADPTEYYLLAAEFVDMNAAEDIVYVLGRPSTTDGMPSDLKSMFKELIVQVQGGDTKGSDTKVTALEARLEAQGEQFAALQAQLAAVIAHQAGGTNIPAPNTAEYSAQRKSLKKEIDVLVSALDDDARDAVWEAHGVKVGTPASSLRLRVPALEELRDALTEGSEDSDGDET